MAKKEEWLHSKWRPMMAWMYFVVCITDFIIFPVAWSIFQATIYVKGTTVEPWNPLTLQGAGLFHLAMGAVLGVAAWSRGQEKMAGVSMPYSRYGYEEEYTQQTPVNTGKVFYDRNGRPAPVITEPLL